jgi:hypothetical protein
MCRRSTASAILEEVESSVCWTGWVSWSNCQCRFADSAKVGWHSRESVVCSGHAATIPERWTTPGTLHRPGGVIHGVRSADMGDIVGP